MIEDLEVVAGADGMRLRDEINALDLADQPWRHLADDLLAAMRNHRDAPAIVHRLEPCDERR